MVAQALLNAVDTDRVGSFPDLKWVWCALDPYSDVGRHDELLAWKPYLCTLFLAVCSPCELVTVLD